jgi:hypothetical protein
MNNEAKKPVKEFRAGRIKAAVWENTMERNGESVTTYSITFQKRFKDKQGKWHDTQQFYADELPRIRLVAQKAYEALVLTETDNGAETD